MSSKTKCWLWMLLVILSETSATSTLKMFDNSEGMTKTLLLALIVVLYCICYYSLSRAVKDIPVGLAYATWSGTGILMVSTLGILFYGLPGYRRHYWYGHHSQRYYHYESVLKNGQ